MKWEIDRVFDTLVIRDREDGWCAAFFPPATPSIHPSNTVALKERSEKILPQARMMCAAPEMQAALEAVEVAIGTDPDWASAM